MEIYNKDNITINYYNNYKFAIHHNNSIGYTKETNALFKSIFHSGFLENVKRNDSFTTVFFQAENVMTFNDFLDQCEKNYGVRKVQYIDCLNIIHSFKNQIMYLERLNHTFYNIVPENVIVIDYEHFLYLGNTIEIIENNKFDKYLQFLKPFKKNGFKSPEINSITTLPTIVDYRAVYYSLALFIYYSLFGENYESKTEKILGNKKDISTDKNLETIYYTKLNWFLLRNLNIDVKKRNIYYI